MPIYEYGCEKCGHHLELLQKVGDPAPKRCPNCRKGKMEKLVSRTSFQLKGSGWYASDYGKTSKKSEDKTEKKSETKSETKSESKADKSASTSSTTSAS